VIIDPSTFRFDRPRGFLALEGVNGAGKSTLQTLIANFLKALNRTVVTTREPGATELGKHLRKILLEDSHGQLGPLTEVFLFAADRAQHVSQIIKPSLESGSVVITDRYFYSTMAFQGYGRGLSVPLLEQINHTAIDGLFPDLTFLLDLEPAEGLKRTKGRNQGDDSFEKENLAFHQRLRSGFMEIAKTCKQPFVVLNAAKSADDVFAQAKPALELWLKSLGAAK
jgi:dTMP kinase